MQGNQVFLILQCEIFQFSKSEITEAFHIEFMQILTVVFVVK